MEGTAYGRFLPSQDQVILPKEEGLRRTMRVSGRCWRHAAFGEDLAEGAAKEDEKEQLVTEEENLGIVGCRPWEESGSRGKEKSTL